MNDSQELEPEHRSVRPHIRQATLILPKTGERVRKTFTLRRSRGDIYDEDERSPLLGFSRRASYGNYSESEQEDGYVKRNVSKAYEFATSQTGIGILKCSLAYLLGSMATFVGPIASLLGRNDGKHMVATITVYFHPARSAGSMQEATFLAVVASLYAAFVSFTSMALSVFFEHQDLLYLGHILILIIFCGGGLGLVGWLKQKLSNPLVNVACSLTSLAIITVLTKEGAVQAGRFSNNKVFQVLKMVVMGIIASTTVSLFVSPVSARKELRNDLRKATSSIADMMTTITSSFLSGSEENLRQPSFTEASQRYRAIFKSLVKNLEEAKREHYLWGTETEYWTEYRLVKCLERLAQDIGGLRSAATTQFSIISNPPVGVSSPKTPSDSIQDSFFSPVDLNSIDGRMRQLAALNEVMESTSTSGDEGHSQLGKSHAASVLTPEDMFNVFISHLGPPMKSLAFTLKEVFEDLPFASGPEYISVINSNFRHSLLDAVELFAKARKEALQLVYKNKIPARSNIVAVAADFEEVAASCGYFSSSLEDFAEDTVLFLDILDELKELLSKRSKERSWKWLYFWRKHTNNDSISPHDLHNLSSHDAETGYMKAIRAPKQPLPPHPKVSPQQRRWTYKLWIASRFLRRDDVKFAGKVGIGAILYAMWSFIPATQDVYGHWRGEWGLLSYMLVCSMTIGASNTTGFQRFFGTCLGAVFAIVAWIVADENPYILAFLGWLVSLACFYLIIGKGKGPMGRFILLTYNLSALYAYSLSVKDEEDDDDEGGVNPEIWGIVLHRVVAVMIGCLWGMVVTRLIWPISARRKLRNGVSLIWLRMSVIWKRDPLSELLDEEKRASFPGLQECLELQRFLSHLESLKSAASSEFELRGPFPDGIYSRILQATSRMVDAFYAMNVLITKDLKASPGETELLNFTRRERMQLSWRVSHLFSVLASSMKLEYPLNDALPNVEHTRDRLLAKIFEFRKYSPKTDLASDGDYELLYAYALVTGQIAQEITAIGRDVELLYGVLNEDVLKLQ